MIDATVVLVLASTGTRLGEAVISGTEGETELLFTNSVGCFDTTLGVIISLGNGINGLDEEVKAVEVAIFCSDFPCINIHITPIQEATIIPVVSSGNNKIPEYRFFVMGIRGAIYFFLSIIRIGMFTGPSEKSCMLIETGNLIVRFLEALRLPVIRRFCLADITLF